MSPHRTPAKAKNIDSVVVTGTRVSNRAAGESLAPIDVMNPADRQGTGTAELATALAQAVRAALIEATDYLDCTMVKRDGCEAR
jgi:hypothetical protein